MALIDLDDIRYLPFLSLRPAEMRALEELPEKTKDAILPIVHLRPWGASNLLANSLRRIEDSYGSRPVVVSIDLPDSNGGQRPVHDEIDLLRRSVDGYKNWCDFIQGHDNYIPAIQVTDLAEMPAQLAFFHLLGRGIFVIIERDGFGGLSALSQTISRHTGGGQNVCVVLDYGLAGKDHLQVAASAVQYLNIISSNCPSARLSISASSFPNSFTSIVRQDIYERLLFDQVRSQRADIIYSDRGSARAERQTGGGGYPAPRIDYPLPVEWKFFRSATLRGFPGYQQEAQNLRRTADWDASLRIWGTLMIERTANGDTSSISTPARSTATRINIHLHRQAFYGDTAGLYDTDDEWSG